MQQPDSPSINASQQENKSLPKPLRVSNVSVTNFRLLRKVDIALSEDTTVLVGRNNSGKTSLAEVLARFLQPAPLKLSLADFSSETYEQFRRSAELYLGNLEDAAREALPAITLTVTIAYDPELPEFGPLSALIVDLDPDCHEAKVRFAYELKGGQLKDLFEGVSLDTDTRSAPTTETVLGVIGDRVPELFSRTITAVDPGDPLNKREITLDAVRKLITVDFLHAQRGLDDEKERPKDLIGRIFQSLFTAASNAENDSAQRKTAKELAKAIEGIESELGAQVQQMVQEVIPALEQFGYPGLNAQELETKTKLDIERLLSNYTSVHYRGVAGVSLPESYSGLGSRNLILILLTLLSYYREYAVRGNVPGVHLVFVEEPEAHLHPQMQEVFIEQLSGLGQLFPAIDGSGSIWSSQFLVSTHSSHIANRASFSAIRYFRVARADPKQKGSHSDVLDLSSAKNIDDNFLHQYLTLTRSDLFFADKAILVEGTSERLIIPKAIEKSATKLSSQYVTLMEVGGAYANKFFPLLDFLGLPSLIITDIDPVGLKDGGKYRSAATVNSGDRTSNATIKSWFDNPEISPSALINAAETSAIKKGNRYLAYQIPEAIVDACGRTFEDAFILANPALFEFDITGNVASDEDAARAEAESYKKSDFALQYAVSDTEWVTPRYIQRGLDWLLSVSQSEVVEGDVEGQGAVAVK